MRLMYAIVLTVFFALASTARADKTDMQVGMSKTDFDAVRSRMIERLDSDRYAEITPQDKAAVIGALNDIGQRLAKPTKVDQDLVDIYNDQELINQITSHAKVESRIYCERDQPTGSHRIRVTCMSLAKWMARENEGQAAMSAISNNHKSHCPGCIYDGPEPYPGFH